MSLGAVFFHPATQFAVAFAALACSLLVLLLVQSHLKAFERHLMDRLKSTEEAVASLGQAVGQLAKDVDELQECGAPAPLPPPPRPGLNLSKRSHALRMYRRGDTPEQIAASLGVPLQEIDLLLKVHQILVANV
jgi:hypothetical protein